MILHSLLKSRSKNNIVINILTRTSKRPKAFKKCRESIEQQTYTNINHIVSYDCDGDMAYLSKYNINTVKVDRELLIEKDQSEDPGTGPFSPHNLYCNVLLSKVKEGWVLFLDDDDMLAHKNVLREISKKIKTANEDTLFIWQMQYPNGKLIPGKDLIRNERIDLYNIGSPCFFFHSKYALKVKWDAWKCADYRFIKNLSHIIPNKIWIEKPYILLNNYGDLGNRNDIQ